MEKISLPDIPQEKVETHKEYPPEAQKYLAKAMIYYRMNNEDLGSQALMFAIDCAEKSGESIALKDIETIMSGSAPSQAKEHFSRQDKSLESLHTNVSEQQQEFAKQLREVSDSIRQQWEILESEMEQSSTFPEAA